MEYDAVVIYDHIMMELRYIMSLSNVPGPSDRIIEPR